MRDSVWDRLRHRLGIDHPPAFLVSHYLLRRCSCHKWPWRSW